MGNFKKENFRKRKKSIKSYVPVLSHTLKFWVDMSLLGLSNTLIF